MFKKNQFKGKIEIGTRKIIFCCFSILAHFVEMFFNFQKQETGTIIKQVHFLKNKKQETRNEKREYYQTGPQSPVLIFILIIKKKTILYNLHIFLLK